MLQPSPVTIVARGVNVGAPKRTDGVGSNPVETERHPRLRATFFLVGFGGLLGGSTLGLVGILGELLDLRPPDLADYPTMAWVGLVLFAVGTSSMVSFAVLPAYEAEFARIRERR